MQNYLTMLFNKDIRKNLKYMHDLFKYDKNYTLSNFLKVNNEILNGRKIHNNGEFTFGVPPIGSKAYRSFIQTAKNHDSAFTDLVLNRKRAPDIFSLAVTAKCHNNCKFCSAHGHKKGEELTTNEWQNVISQIQDLGSCIIEFTGGEPLLRDDLEEIISSIDDRSRSFVATSGFGLTIKRAISLKNAGLNGVFISIDSPDSKENDETRGDGAYETAIKAVKNALKAELCVIINCIIPKNRLNEKYVFEICHFAQKMGANEILLIKPLRAGRLLNVKEEPDIYYDNEATEKMQIIYRRAVKKFKKLKIFSSALLEWDKTRGCIGGIQLSYINFTGELFPCDFLPLSFGNVRHEPLKDIWTKMNVCMGIPKRQCMCTSLLNELRNNELPINKEKSLELCKNIRETEYPDGYKKFIARCKND